jgi:apolipoprotein D and lipocalin family protein
LDPRGAVKQVAQYSGEEMKTHKFCALLALLAAFAASGSRARDLSNKPIDPERFYKGTWLEVARRPMWITDGCNRGTTSYIFDRRTKKIQVRDACLKAGEEVALDGEAEIVDPGVNRRINVRYNPLLSVDYHIADHANDGSWFIETSDALSNIFIFTRKPPSKAQLAMLVARAHALGYDTSGLEFPWSDSGK